MVKFTTEAKIMDASYDKLFKLLIDKKMQKNDLAAAAGISYS